MADIRSFIAIELNEDARDEVARIQKQLINSRADVKWVEPNNIHLTLKFLGNVPEEKLGEIKDAINEAIVGIAPFCLELTEIGAFPDTKYTRVVWIGAKEDAGNLMNIATRMEEKMLTLGFPKEERRFKPHLTLGRVRSPKNKDKLKDEIIQLRQGENKGGPIKWKIADVVLFKSELTPKGSIYTTLFKAHLTG